MQCQIKANFTWHTKNYFYTFIFKFLFEMRSYSYDVDDVGFGQAAWGVDGLRAGVEGVVAPGYAS